MAIPDLLKNSAIYSFVSILQKGIMFFLLPIFTIYLSPRDYGILNVITSISSFISIFIVLSLDAAARRFYFTNANPFYVKKLWGTIAVFLLINSFTVGGVLVILHKFLLDPLLANINFYPYMLLGIGYAVLSPIYLFFQTYLQTKQDGFSYGLNVFVNFLIQTTLILIFLIIFKLGVIGILLAYNITCFIFFIYVCVIFFPKIKMRINYKILKNAFQYSIPLIPHSIFAWSSGMIDKLFLNKMIGESDTGLYSVGQQFGGITSVVATSMNQAYVPWFFERENRGEIGYREIEKTGQVLIIFYCFIALTLSLFSREVLLLMVSEEYRSIGRVIPIIAFGYVFQGVYFLYVNVLFLKHTSMVFLITLVSTIVNVISNVIMIPIYGILGSALSGAITLLIQSILTLILSRIKNNQIRYNSVDIYFNIFLSFSIAMLASMIDCGSLIYDICYKSIILIVFLIIILIRYKHEIRVLIGIFRK